MIFKRNLILFLLYIAIILFPTFSKEWDSRLVYILSYISVLIFILVINHFLHKVSRKLLYLFLSLSITSIIFISFDVKYFYIVSQIVLYILIPLFIIILLIFKKNAINLIIKIIISFILLIWIILLVYNISSNYAFIDGIEFLFISLLLFSLDWTKNIVKDIKGLY